MKVVIILALTTLAVASANVICAGCQEPVDLGNAKHILNVVLQKLAANEGPYYSTGKINSATQQVVAGIIYKINAELIEGTTKVVDVCDVEIFKQVPSGTQVTFKCLLKDQVVVTY